MKIEEYAKVLHLPYLRTNVEQILKEGTELKLSHKELILHILENEYETRKNNGINHKIKNAKFTHKKYLENYITDHFEKNIQEKISEFSTLDFIDNKENIILLGNPGTGKSHLAIALGLKACHNNKNVLFISVPNLIIELKEAMSNSQLHNYKKKFDKFDLVILDELGYVSFDKEGSEILFNLLSSRNDKGSIIVTSNLTFERWEEIFKDPILTGAMIDRLAHKSHLLDLTGESFRMKETKDWMNQK